MVVVKVMKWGDNRWIDNGRGAGIVVVGAVAVFERKLKLMLIIYN